MKAWWCTDALSKILRKMMWSAANFFNVTLTAKWKIIIYYSPNNTWGAFATLAELGLALAGAQWPCLRPWPSFEPGHTEPKPTSPPGPGKTQLGFISPLLGCARRWRGDFGGGGVARAGSRGTVKVPARHFRGAGSLGALSPLPQSWRL
jgi:hypothetical protein